MPQISGFKISVVVYNIVFYELNVLRILLSSLLPPLLLVHEVVAVREAALQVVQFHLLRQEILVVLVVESSNRTPNHPPEVSR